MRRSLAWLVAVPLIIAGSQAAHVLTYRWVYPVAHVRLHELVASGHDYMSLMPLVLGIAGAVTALSLALSAVDAARGRTQRALPAWAFALLPLVAFTVQEHLERWLASGVFPWHAAAEPTFLPGLALQLPFGLVAYLAARLLLRAAEGVGRALVQPAAPRPRFVPVPISAPARRRCGAAAAPDRQRAGEARPAAPPPRLTVTSPSGDDRPRRGGER